MARRLAALMLIVLALLITAGGTPPATAQPSNRPQFQPAPCPFEAPPNREEGSTLRCGFVTAPEDRANPAGAQVRLAVAVFSALDARPSDAALLYLPGGPGGGGLDDLAAGLLPSFARVLAGGQDFVVFDPRGTGYSQPLLACPELDDLDTSAVIRH